MIIRLCLLAAFCLGFCSALALLITMPTERLARLPATITIIIPTYFNQFPHLAWSSLRLSCSLSLSPSVCPCVYLSVWLPLAELLSLCLSLFLSISASLCVSVFSELVVEAFNLPAQFSFSIFFANAVISCFVIKQTEQMENQNLRLEQLGQFQFLITSSNWVKKGRFNLYQFIGNACKKNTFFSLNSCFKS